MPLNKEMSMPAKVLLVVAVVAAVWLGSSMALLPVGVIAANSEVLMGLTVLTVLGWWAYSEAEEDDDVAEVIGKTSSRAESASKGFLDGTRALILGVVMVLVTVGGELMATVAGLTDIAGMAPGVVGSTLAGGAAIAGTLGLLSFEAVVVLVVAIVLLVAYSRQDS